MSAAEHRLRAPAAQWDTRLYVPMASFVVLLGGAVAFTSPLLAIWLLLACAAAALGVFRPAGLLYLLAPAVAFGSLFALNVGSLQAGPTDLLVGALAVSMLLRLAPRLRDVAVSASGDRTALVSWTSLVSWMRRERERAWLTLGLGAYLCVIVLSIAVARSHTSVLKETLKWAEVLVVVLAASTLVQPAQRAITAWMIVVAGVAESLLGYVQWVLSAGDLGVGGAGVRVFGTFAQPNPYAAFLNFSLPVALALGVFSRRSSWRWIAVGSAALMLGAQVLADSRGATLALAAAVAVMVVVTLGVERWAAIAGGAAAVLAVAAWVSGVFPQSLQERALRLFRVNGVSLSGPVNDANFSSVERLAHWVAGIRMFLAHPVLGVGAGNYSAAYARYADPNWPQALGHAHDYYINAAAETGILGLIAFLLLMGTMLYVSWRAARLALGSGPRLRNLFTRTRVDFARAAAGREADLPVEASGNSAGQQVLRALALGVLGVMVAVAVHSLVDDLFVHAMELQLALCVGLALGVVRTSAGRVSAV